MSNEIEEKTNDENISSITVIREVYEARLKEKEAEIAELKRKHADEIRAILEGKQETVVEDDDNSFEEEMIEIMRKKLKL